MSSRQMRPWQPLNERNVAHVLEELKARGPRLVALSAHDSSPWTCDAFAAEFGKRYRTVRVGEEIRIDPAQVLWARDTIASAGAVAF